MAVSPFDGANRIRFKGSPDCGFAIADCGIEKQIRIQHSEIHISLGLSAAHALKAAAPPKAVLIVNPICGF